MVTMSGELPYVLALGLLLLAQQGCSTVVESVPESGSIVAGLENETNILVQCEVFDGSVQQITLWFILTVDDEDGEPNQLLNLDPGYTFTGDPVPGGGGLTFRNNLTILTLTSDFDRAVLFCARSSDLSEGSNFTLRIYRPPILQDVGLLTAVEGDAFPNGGLGLEMNEPFPVPTEFTWRRDGGELMDTSTLTLGYPELSIDPVSRTDSGNYTLTASNYRLDNDSVLIGTDTGGFYLDVLFLSLSPSLPSPTPTPVSATPSTAVVSLTTTPTPSPPMPPMPPVRMGGDPHYSVLLQTGQLLCFSVHGEKDFSFNLISSDLLQMNARFIQDPVREEITWIGSLGVVLKDTPNPYRKSNITKLRFEAAEKKVYIGDKASLVAQRVEKLTFSKGKLTISHVQGLKKTKRHNVLVDMQDIGLSFSVRFVKDHLDLSWEKISNQLGEPHGMIGQFFREGNEIDETRKLLLLPNLDPIPVMRRKVWQFMEREVPDDQLCWVAMNPGYQGKRLIEGNYLDYLVDDVLSQDFNL